MNWSSEQTAIFDYFATGSGNAIIEAFAGTGKTTTIKEAFNHAPEQRCLYAVFNKKNQREATEKIKDARVEVKTLHSLGYQFIKRVWTKVQPDDEVETDRINAIQNLDNRPDARQSVLKLIGFAKNTVINPTTDDLKKICIEQDLEFPEGVNGIDIALKVLEASKIQDEKNRISFNDMVWLPVVMGWCRPRFNLVVIDECQDMNLPQLLMAKASCEVGGRIVVVGDSKQAIYGFRGATQNAMGMMKVTLRARVFSLTTTYRCPKSVVALAAELVPGYKAADEAPEGEVKNVTDTVTALPGDAILSRLNAPLMPLALGFLRRNVPARIEGRDIGRQLVGMVKSMRAKSVPNFIEKVGQWLTKQEDRLKGTKNADKRLEQSNDIAQTLIAVAENASSVADIELKLSSLFQDTDSNSKPAIVLSSVHKAKGLEWPRVFILSETFRKGKGQEEDNIYYVAITRAQRILNFVSGGKGTVSPVEPEQLKVEPAADKNNIGGETKPHDTLNVCRAEVQAQHVPADIQTGEAKGEPAGDIPPAPILSTSYDINVLPGMIAHEIGNVINQDKHEYVCDLVNASGARFRRVGNASDIIHLSATTWPGEIIRKVNFRPAIVQADGETQNNGQQTTQNITDMAKEKKGGKIAFVDNALTKGKYTVQEIAESLATTFEVNPKTALNTVRWCKSTFDTRPANEGKTVKVKEAKPEAKAEKPAEKSKAPKAKKAKAEKPEAEAATEAKPEKSKAPARKKIKVESTEPTPEPVPVNS